MKKMILVFCSGILFFSCTNEPGASKDSMKDSADANHSVSASVPDYPYTIDHPDNWETGSNTNTLAALRALKTWEEGKFDESASYFADSIQVRFDGLDTKLSRDSLKSMFKTGWNDYKTINIKMYDWESVISKDKNQEWVTLWYRQSWENKSGKKDSMDVVNDLQLKNGKITRLDEYKRKLN